LRGDVLRLLEDLDNLMNIYEADLYRFSIQRPVIPGEYRKDFLELVETAVACVECVVLSARSFFRDIEAVRDHNSKVMFHEHPGRLHLHAAAARDFQLRASARPQDAPAVFRRAHRRIGEQGRGHRRRVGHLRDQAPVLTANSSRRGIESSVFPDQRTVAGLGLRRQPFRQRVRRRRSVRGC
jgi:hypothetical protein